MLTYSTEMGSCKSIGKIFEEMQDMLAGKIDIENMHPNTKELMEKHRFMQPYPWNRYSMYMV